MEECETWLESVNCVSAGYKIEVFFFFFPFCTRSNRGQNEPIVGLDKNTIFYTLLFQKPPPKSAAGVY